MTVIYEDDTIVVIDKPAGQNSQPTPMGDFDSVITLATRRWGPGMRLVHRLDRDASGLLVLARNPAVAAWLSQGFRLHKIRRTYRARISIPLPMGMKGTIDRPMKWAGGRAWVDDGGAKAITHWTVVAAHPDGTTELEVELETGRMHQIRVHLAAALGPIVGDTKYGGAPAPALALRAVRLELLHPNTRVGMVFEVVALPVE